MATTIELSFSVLAHREEDGWCALALEMDLRGYGGTYQAAVSDLMDHVRMQASFAMQRGTPELMFHQAEPHYWDLYFQTKRQALTSLMGKKKQTSDYRAGEIPMTKGMFHTAKPAPRFELARA